MMGKTANIGLEEYNTFCRNLKEGNILYNIDTTNFWGEYLLVAHKVLVRVQGVKTYTILLIGLQKENDQYKPRNIMVVLTPDCASSIPFLKYVGYCKFKLYPIIDKADVNLGLVAAYSEVDLRKYAYSINMRKPQKTKYGKDGKPVIKKLNN